MDSVSSVSPSVVLPPRNPLRRRESFLASHKQHEVVQFSNPMNPYYNNCTTRRRRRRLQLVVCCKFSGGRGEDNNNNNNNIEREEDDDDELKRALELDGTIPGSSDEFVKQVSSRAYDMRRHLQQTFDTSSYDVLESNPWRESSKAVYVLTQRENQLCTMKTRRNRSEVERELGKLFSKGGKLKNQAKQFQMLVEDISEGVLVFEDENEASKYCDLLQGGGQGCEGVAEIDASSVFDLCQKMKALAVLFRRGRTPPVPESLKLNLRARKRSLEDQEDLK